MYILLIFIILYFQFYINTTFSIIIIIFIGIVFDIFCNVLLGEHVFSLLFISFIFNKKLEKFYCFPLWKKILLIEVSYLINKFIITGIDYIVGNNVELGMYLFYKL